MAKSYIYKTYTVRGDKSTVCEKITNILVSNGFILTGETYLSRNFKYPSLTFSSKKPLTCISRLSLNVKDSNGISRLTIGVTFSKIRNFTIIIILLICVVLPVMLSFAKYGYDRLPEIPLPAYLGIPLGFMVHYHVRWRVFRVLRRLAESVEYDDTSHKE
ncbi:MAG: hypothetical protein JXB48_04715 [Candidatus Latescibacteria bacterium]|nr:hypothetical protein [Candidatus Latescibacterota bacterium]